MTSWSKIRRGWENRFPHLDEDWTHWWIEGDGNFLILIEGCSLAEAIEYVFECREVYVSIKAYRAKYNDDGMPIREKSSYEITNKKNECRPSYPNGDDQENLTNQFSGCGKPPR
jgi:hypothetical protein